MTSSTDSTRETWTAAIRYITGRKSAEESLGFLAHVSALLDSNSDPAAFGKAVAGVAVPYLASAASLDVAGSDTPVTSGDPAHTDALTALRTAAAGRSGTYVLSGHEKLADTSAPRPDGVPAEAVSSAIVVPLRFRGVSSGALVLARGPRHPKGDFGPADLALVSELAARIAVGNALAAAPSTTTG